MAGMGAIMAEGIATRGRCGVVRRAGMRYSEQFYADRCAVAVPAARRVMHALCEFVRPASLIDVGCGDGSFLSVMPEFDIGDFVGVDGPWIGDEQLRIRLDRFRRVDLNQPFRCERRYDMAISIEVAEHLRPERAEGFVTDLVRLSDVVLFSAAIPHQGGVHHLNERWQSYWASLFHQHGYRPIDALRPLLWSSPEVPVPWRQNMLIYAGAEGLARWAPLAEASERSAGSMLDIVHPLAFWRARKPRGVGYLLTRQAPAALRYTLRRLGRERERRLNKPV